MKGTIVRKRSEGYGFIKPEDSEKDVFFHVSAVVDAAFDDLNEGDTVTFEVEEGPKGPAATNVQKVAGEAAAPAGDDASDDAASDTDEATEEAAPAAEGEGEEETPAA